MSVLAKIDIDWTALGKAGYYSVGAGLLICLLAGVGVASSLMAARSREGEGQGGTAAGTASGGGFLAITGLCILGLAALIVYGIYLLQK